MANSVEPIQRDGSTANAAWMIISNLIAGIVLYGGIGWLLSLWLGHRAVFVAGGVLVGTALSLYLVHVRTSQGADEPPEKR
jgi:F0F1-type ATP synthase assembly protein I